MHHQNDLVRIALVGDFDPAVIAHQAIERNFAAAGSEGDSLTGCWLSTPTIRPGDDGVFEGYRGIWLVPGSPYRNTAGALWAVEFARTQTIPFLGTCGGFQHALLEYARNVLGQHDLEHAELNPDTGRPLFRRMRCALVEEEQMVIPSGGRQFIAACGTEPRREGYHCRYELNPAYEPLLAHGSLEIVARSEQGQVRAVELRDHPFFVGTMFQPERRALRGSLHPLVAGFFAACRRGGTHRHAARV